MNIINNGLDISREKLEQDGSEWSFGATSQEGLAIIPEADRMKYLPIGENQFGKEDFMDCATRGPVNNMETQFTFLYQNNKLKPENKMWFENNGYVQDNRITFSDRFTAIKSGTTRQGNSIKGPIDAIHTYGLIPKKMLPKEDWMTFDDYHDRSKITNDMLVLGLEFIKRFSINYEQVEEVHYETLFEKDLLVQAGYAWTNPVNGVYPNPGNELPNHVWLGVRRPRYVIYDNYLDTDGDYIKVLAPDYNMFDYGYRVYISAENVVATPLSDTQKKSFLDQLRKLLEMLGILQKQVDALPKPSPAPVVPVVKSKSDTLYEVSRDNLGKRLTLDSSVSINLGCAEAVSYVLKQAGYNIPAKGISGTYTLFEWLKKNFQKIDAPEKGCVVISPTTTSIGHTGICGQFNYMYKNDFCVMSNDSDSGLFDTKWKLENWKVHYKDLGTYYFRPI